jgi:NAD(P)-dependent dehydrogenase (short-subunit alcohol dehydrogenase family)
MKKRLMLAFAFVLPLLVPPPASAQTPNRGDVVRGLAGSGPGAVLMQACKTSKDACGQFTRLAACTLAPEGFGLLTKNPGENQVAGFAVDAIIFKTTNQVIDIISQNESPNASPGWTEVAKRSGNNWAAPVGCGPVDPPPPPPPPPTSDAATSDLQQQQLEVLREQLATSKALLELLQKAASKFGVK